MIVSQPYAGISGLYTCLDTKPAMICWILLYFSALSLYGTWKNLIQVLPSFTASVENASEKMYYFDFTGRGNENYNLNWMNKLVDKTIVPINVLPNAV